MFQNKRKCALIAQNSTDARFFESTETEGDYPRITQECIADRIKAAYDIRSMFLHTGKSHGVWATAYEKINAEVIIGEPVIPDADLKKLVIRAPTLAGLERVIHYCIYTKLVQLFAE